MEWQVVGVLAVLVGLLGAVVAPIVKLNTSLTRLTVLIDRLEFDHKTDMQKNTESHRRIWEKLDDHGDRITHLEHDKGGTT